MPRGRKKSPQPSFRRRPGSILGQRAMSQWIPAFAGMTPEMSEERRHDHRTHPRRLVADLRLR
ncbi:hypothetical protein D3874_05695 [Oleomonas cavernae]|uniref:Uncharacterized protein n=1 Tax=Oleomonas cavernae TaxID=2320859 RepID=A0A418W981_9PROT|nr:hypothetical protein D3874_05695 [Oleomonas cavernae]